MITEKFKEEYGKLNKAQKEAVDTIEGPVMVIAGPGTGKTTILTLRIANILLKTDTPPSGILALTFTDAGAKTMKKKLREIIGERALEVPIHTFHGFAGSVIAEFEDHLPHLARSKQLSEVESENLVREILKDNKYKKLRPLGDQEYYVQKIISAISDCKKEAWTPEMVKIHAKKEIEIIKEDPDSISSRGATKGKIKAEAERRIEKCERTIIFAQAYEEYEKKKREERKIDFDDLIFELLLGLRKNELLLRSLQEKYLYILVDEHQDSNDAQNTIIKTLADFFETPNLFVVGDDKQAIYRFQGASVENFLAFQKNWSGMKIIPLTENYRSHQKILDATFGMIEKNYTGGELIDLRVKLKAGGKVKGAPLEILSAPNIESEEAHFTEMLKEIPKSKNIAVIVRNNKDVTKIFRLLEAEGVDASAERGANIFDHPIGISAFALFAFMIDPSDNESLSLTFASGLWGLDFESSAKMIQMARSGNFSEIEKKLPKIKRLRSEILNSGALEFLILVGEESGLVSLAARDPLATEVWRSLIALAQDLAKNNLIENPIVLIKELLSYQKSAERRSVKIKTGSLESRILIMTAHGSKGLEFDYVFLPYATEESWMKKSRGNPFVLPREKEDGDNLRDERRLFYVALTRAKERIIISFHKEDGGSNMSPLRFIDELDQNLISRKEIGKLDKKTKNNLLDKKKKQKKELIEYSKRVLEEKGISVTALNHFIKCPSEFLYKSILKIPEAPSPSSEKGNAMHEAMANVWKFVSSHTPNTYPKAGREGEIADIISKSVINYFKNSLLPKNDKEVAVEDLLKSAPKVAETLASHFNQDGIIITEGWFENTFEMEMESKKIEIKIHGKLDVLIEKEKEVLIYDYKTRESMSEKAIRGETKNDDGNYFRQLVFYKMLLEKNPKYKNKSIRPALVFIKFDPKRGCPTIEIPIRKEDTKKLSQEISDLTNAVWSGSFITSKCPDSQCKFCSIKNQINFEG